MCRNDPTIKKIGKMLWNKDRAKVDKTDEVRKTVMASMRNLAQLFILIINSVQEADGIMCGRNSGSKFDVQYNALGIAVGSYQPMSREETMTAP